MYIVQILLKRNVFKLDLKEDRLGTLCRGFGREYQVAVPMSEKERFPYLLSLMRGTVMRPASAERREREVDRQREDQTSRQE